MILLTLVLVQIQLKHGLHVDEGQYLLISRTILDGGVPYRDIWENKPVGLYFMLLPVVLIAGTNIELIRLLSALNVLVSAFLVYWITLKSSDSQLASAFASFLFILLSFDSVINGYFFLTEPLSNTLITLSIALLLSKRLSFTKYLLSAVSFSFSIWVRQTSILFLLPIFFICFSRKKTQDAIKPFLIGGIAVFLPFIFYLVYTDTLTLFFRDVILSPLFAGVVGSQLSTPEHQIVFLFIALMTYFFLPFLVVIGVWESFKKREASLFLVFWLLSGLISVIAVHNFTHNLLPLLPPVAIISGIGLKTVVRAKDYFANALSRYFSLAIIYLTFFSVLILFLSYAISDYGSQNECTDLQAQKALTAFFNAKEGSKMLVFMRGGREYYLTQGVPITKTTHMASNLISYFLNGNQTPDAYFPSAQESVCGPLVNNPDAYLILFENDENCFSEVLAASNCEVRVGDYSLIGNMSKYRIYARAPN